MAKLLTFDEAVHQTVELARPSGDEELAILKSYGRVLRQDVSSPVAIPPFDRSTMDGYAVPFPNQKFGVLKSMVCCSALIDVPSDTTTLAAGSSVLVIPLEPGWPAG